MQRTIHQTRPLFRYLFGYLFFLVGAAILPLLLTGVIIQNNRIAHDWPGILVGVAFVFVGLCIIHDDFIVIDYDMRVVRFHGRRLLMKSPVLYEQPLESLPSPVVEAYDNPSPRGDRVLYRIMLDGFCVRNEMSRSDAECYRDKLGQWLKQ